MHSEANLPLVFHLFFEDAATTEIYTLSLHDALPIYRNATWVIREERTSLQEHILYRQVAFDAKKVCALDRKSTRLNSSHSSISYAVFCLKKKNYFLRQTILTITITMTRHRKETKSSH